MFLLFAARLAAGAETCAWETSWTACKGSDTARVCQNEKAAGSSPSDAEARHDCYEARAVEIAGWTREAQADCVISCKAAAAPTVPTIGLPEGAAPDLRAALRRVGPALGACVASLPTPPKVVTVSGNVSNGNYRVSSIDGSTPAVETCLTTALHGTSQAGRDGAVALTLRWAAPAAPPAQ